MERAVLIGCIMTKDTKHTDDDLIVKRKDLEMRVWSDNILKISLISLLILLLIAVVSLFSPELLNVNL